MIRYIDPIICILLIPRRPHILPHCLQRTGFPSGSFFNSGIFNFLQRSLPRWNLICPKPPWKKCSFSRRRPKAAPSPPRWSLPRCAICGAICAISAWTRSRCAAAAACTRWRIGLCWPAVWPMPVCFLCCSPAANHCSFPGSGNCILSCGGWAWSSPSTPTARCWPRTGRTFLRPIRPGGSILPFMAAAMPLMPRSAMPPAASKKQFVPFPS